MSLILHQTTTTTTTKTTKKKQFTKKQVVRRGFGVPRYPDGINNHILG